MTRTKRVVVLGAGNIGAEAAMQLKVAGYEVAGVVRSDHYEILVGDKYAKRPIKKPGDASEVASIVGGDIGNPDAFVSAIAGGDGVFEGELMYGAVTAGIPWISAAKVTLATQFARFAPHLHLIGRNAMVGGGTMMLDYMRRHLVLGNGHDAVVELVINGTKSYFMTNRWKGRPIEAIKRECVMLKLAEPTKSGAMPDLLELFRGEGDDVIWKLLIVLNDIFHTHTGRYIKKTDIRRVPLTQHQLDQYLVPSARVKYVVQIATKKQPLEIPRDSPGSIWLDIKGKHPIHVCGGFFPIPQGTERDTWVPDIGPGNAVRVIQNGVTPTHSADGAGPVATVTSIMHDVRTLCPLG